MAISEDLLEVPFCLFFGTNVPKFLDLMDIKTSTLDIYLRVSMVILHCSKTLASCYFEENLLLVGCLSQGLQPIINRELIDLEILHARRKTTARRV